MYFGFFARNVIKSGFSGFFARNVIKSGFSGFPWGMYGTLPWGMYGTLPWGMYGTSHGCVRDLPWVCTGPPMGVYGTSHGGVYGTSHGGCIRDLPWVCTGPPHGCVWDLPMGFFRVPKWSFYRVFRVPKWSFYRVFRVPNGSFYGVFRVPNGSFYGVFRVPEAEIHCFYGFSGSQRPKYTVLRVFTGLDTPVVPYTGSGKGCVCFCTVAMVGTPWSAPCWPLVTSCPDPPTRRGNVLTRLDWLLWQMPVYTTSEGLEIH